MYFFKPLFHVVTIARSQGQVLTADWWSLARGYLMLVLE